PLRAVTKAPYFIHFITTPDYDRLIVVFNKNEQKRIISFRNRLTNTQYFKIVKQWEGISSKSKIEFEDVFWKSLDVKEVNKEFFKLIKERFDSLLGILKTKSPDINDEIRKQFVIKLIGRYLFCWFLKEKNIVPYELICKKKIESTKDYFKTYLQKLFFDTLNTKVDERNLSNLGDSYFKDIPYLNGGLFDESEEDIIFRDIVLDDWLISFVNVLESYDFTVDESSSTYQQVAVDPEMLGRIFENLLASQNPETEKAANERKSFGAFYTPREIVDFMVNESLKSYLSDKLNITPEDIESAFGSNPLWPDKLKNKKSEAESYLKKIKILDPACGSGAFPISVLHKLITLRELTGFNTDAYILKKDILSNNIYGIDIMPMAVEIARLRAWLSLIVEEDYKPDKSNINFGIDSLPNLDFKFMQGNSLLETYEGIKLFEDKLLEVNLQNQKKETINKLKQEIKLIQVKITKPENGKVLNESQKKILLKEAELKQQRINKIQKNNTIIDTGDIFVREQESVNISQKLKELHKEIFNTSDKEKKKSLKEEIDTLEWNLIVTTLQENGKGNKIEEIENLRKKNIKPYFIYKLNFPEVFTENKGFDIVIGNPPYVKEYTSKKSFNGLRDSPYYQGKMDIWYFFACKSLDILKQKTGILSFIATNNWLTNYGASKMRKKIIFET
ncbi:MAG TPA: N-6 DNA methylase, partial [Ignavibacteria bacterium]